MEKGPERDEKRVFLQGHLLADCQKFIRNLKLFFLFYMIL